MPHLSGFAFAVVTLTALLGVIGQWAGGYLHDLWRLPAAALIAAASLEALWLRRRTLAIARLHPGEVHLGRPFETTLRLDNPGRARLRVRAVQPLPPELSGAPGVLEWDLPAGASAARRFIVVPHALGPAAFGPIHARVLGAFGLAWWERRLAPDGRLVVTPDYLGGGGRRTATTAYADISTRSTGSGLELLGLRDYQPGDPLRAIDWKATARSRIPTVRVYARERRLEIAVLLDAGLGADTLVGNLSRLHHRVNVAARLLEQAIGNGDRAALIVFADRVLERAGPMASRRDLPGLRATLARARAAPVASDPVAAALALRHLIGHRCLVVLLSDPDDDGACAELREAMRALAPKHLTVLAAIDDESLTALIERPARHWFDPYHALGALELRRIRDRAMADLGHRGTRIVLARPAELDRAVLDAYERLRGTV
jgi:uncharacterized protein (DUF58 family)